MASRGNAARNTASKDVFEGRVRKWERGYVVHKKGTLKSETTLELLRWIQTEARCPELTGPRHPHIKPLKKPVIKQAKLSAEEAAEAVAEQAAAPTAEQPSGPPPGHPVAPADPTPKQGQPGQACELSAGATAAGAVPTDDEQQARVIAASESGASTALPDEPLGAAAGKGEHQGNAMEDVIGAEGNEAAAAEAPSLDVASGVVNTAGASAGDGTGADRGDVHMTETGSGQQ